MSKRIKIEGGKNCPKCREPMQRFEHASTWKPKACQPYFFRYWDFCKACNHVQHYEKAKVQIHETA